MPDNASGALVSRSETDSLRRAPAHRAHLLSAVPQDEAVLGGRKQERALGTIDLKGAMRHLVGAVSVITTGQGRRRTGATVTSAHSLSIEPETMLVSLNRSSSTWPVLNETGSFCVNILAGDQQEVADRFAGRGGEKGPERYAGAAWTQLVTGSGVLTGALASIDCELEHVVERHSHVLVFGRVRAIVASASGPALIYAHGRYGTATPPLG